MIYTQLPQTYCDDVLAEAIYGREVEFFHYDFDRNNFTKLLEDMPSGAYRDDIENRLVGTIEQMHNVESIYNALISQITNQEAHDAAVLRTTEKRINHVPTK
jgi:hypothetical protein